MTDDVKKMLLKVIGGLVTGLIVAASGTVFADHNRIVRMEAQRESSKEQLAEIKTKIEQIDSKVDLLNQQVARMGAGARNE